MHTSVSSMYRVTGGGILGLLGLVPVGHEVVVHLAQGLAHDVPGLALGKQEHRGPYALDAHLAGAEPELLGQADGLAGPVAEQFGSGGHVIFLVYTQI